jgi:Uma2 family endonuclease
MGMSQTAKRWTADKVRALPQDPYRYEVIDGELFVTPAPTAQHQRAVRQLFVRLAGYLSDDLTRGELLFSPADISFHEDMLVQTDLFIVPPQPGGRRVLTWREIRGLLLAVEVLSPTTARADRQVKRRLYQHERVGEYWIVDLDARVVERWRPADERPEILTTVLTWQPEPAVTPFELDLQEFFRAVLDD